MGQFDCDGALAKYSALAEERSNGNFPHMIFAILAADNSTTLAAAITRHYPTDHRQLAEGQWLVVDKGTAKEVADKLGITTGEAGGGLVVSVSGYFGRKPADLWEWMKVKMAQTTSG